MGNDRSWSPEPRRGSEGIQSTPRASFGSFVGEWRRRGQLEPRLVRLRREQGEAAAWRYGVRCLELLRWQHAIAPEVLAAAGDAFCDPTARSRALRRFGSVAANAFTIGVKHGMPHAASFLAAFRLLDERPITAVAEACAFARLAAALRRRGAMRRVLPPSPPRRASADGSNALIGRAIERELARIVSIDEETAHALVARGRGPGGGQTRRSLAHLAAIEGEALAWGEQSSLLDALLEEGEVRR